jgi:hypothetical protein
VDCRERQSQIDVDRHDSATHAKCRSERRTKGLFDSDVTTTTYESDCCNGLDDVMSDRPFLGLGRRSAMVVGKDYVSSATTSLNDSCHRESNDAVGGTRTKGALTSKNANKHDKQLEKRFGTQPKDGARVTAVPCGWKSLLNDDLHESLTATHSSNSVEPFVAEARTNGDRISDVFSSCHLPRETIKPSNVIRSVRDDEGTTVCGCCGKPVRQPSDSSDSEAPEASQPSIAGSADDGGSGNDSYDDDSGDDGNVDGQRVTTSAQRDDRPNNRCSRSVQRRADDEDENGNKHRKVDTRTSPRSNRSHSAPPSTGLFSPLWSYLFKTASTTSVTSSSNGPDGRMRGSMASTVVDSAPSTLASGGSSASTTFLWSPWLRTESNRPHDCGRNLSTPSDTSCLPKPEVCSHVLTSIFRMNILQCRSKETMQSSYNIKNILK